MGTRSYICRRNEDGTLTGVYCHWDGYPRGVGAELLAYYKTARRVNALLALGNLSALGPKIAPRKGQKHSFDHPAKNVTIAYGRDRGEKGQEAQEVRIKDLVQSGSWIEYVYVFDLDGRWRYVRSCDYWDIDWNADKNRFVTLRDLSADIKPVDEN